MENKQPPIQLGRQYIALPADSKSSAHIHSLTHKTDVFPLLLFTEYIATINAGQRRFHMVKMENKFVDFAPFLLQDGQRAVVHRCKAICKLCKLPRQEHTVRCCFRNTLLDAVWKCEFKEKKKIHSWLRSTPLFDYAITCTQLLSVQNAFIKR